jgi:cell wall-associated NlpC family hydrolase
MVSVAEIERWDLAAIAGVFSVAQDRAAAMQRLGDNLDAAEERLGGWEGEAGDAFRAELGRIRTDIDEHHRQSTAVARAVEQASHHIAACKTELQAIKRAAAGNSWRVTGDARIDIGATGRGRARDLRFITAWQSLQQRLDALMQAAGEADHELAAAIRAAAGDGPPSAAPSKTGPTIDAGREQRPGVTDVNDTGVQWNPAVQPDTWKDSPANPLLTDNPPGYSGPAGPARDAAWQDYLRTYSVDAGRGFLPRPDAVADPGLKVLAHAAAQLGISYAWGGGGPPGPGKGGYNYDDDGQIVRDGAYTYQDPGRIGFDCSGLSEYSVATATGLDIGKYTGTQVSSPLLTVVGPGEPVKPGDLVFYGDEPHHVAIYLAPGVVINAPQSGLPVQVNTSATAPGTGSGELVRVRRVP